MAIQSRHALRQVDSGTSLLLEPPTRSRLSSEPLHCFSEGSSARRSRVPTQCRWNSHKLNDLVIELESGIIWKRFNCRGLVISLLVVEAIVKHGLDVQADNAVQKAACKAQQLLVLDNNDEPKGVGAASAVELQPSKVAGWVGGTRARRYWQ